MLFPETILIVLTLALGIAAFGMRGPTGISWKMFVFLSIISVLAFCDVSLSYPESSKSPESPESFANLMHVIIHLAWSMMVLGGVYIISESIIKAINAWKVK